jgi:hypothetical protein
MSNRRRRKRMAAGAAAAGKAPEPSCHLTTGRGAQPYDEETLAILARLVPGAEFVHPLGIPDETDKDRLSRARGMAGHHKRPFAAVLRLDTMGTLYFKQLALGHASRVLVMHSKVRHVGADAVCPFPTMIVVFNGTNRGDRIPTAPVEWEAS